MDVSFLKGMTLFLETNPNEQRKNGWLKFYIIYLGTALSNISRRMGRKLRDGLQAECGRPWVQSPVPRRKKHIEKFLQYKQYILLIVTGFFHLKHNIFPWVLMPSLILLTIIIIANRDDFRSRDCLWPGITQIKIC